MAHAQKPDFVFPRNGRVHLNRWGRQFSRLLTAEVCASAWVMLDRPRSEVAWEYWLPTPFGSFPFTSPPVRHREPPGSERALLHTLSWCARDNNNLKFILSYHVPSLGQLVGWPQNKYKKHTQTAGPTFSSTPQLLRLISLIPYSKVIALDVLVCQLAKTFTAFYGTRKIITELTEPMHQIFGVIMQVQINGFSTAAVFVNCWTASCESLTLRASKCTCDGVRYISTSNSCVDVEKVLCGKSTLRAPIYEFQSSKF